MRHVTLRSNKLSFLFLTAIFIALLATSGQRIERQFSAEPIQLFVAIHHSMHADMNANSSAPSTAKIKHCMSICASTTGQTALMVSAHQMAHHTNIQVQIAQSAWHITTQNPPAEERPPRQA